MDTGLVRKRTVTTTAHHHESDSVRGRRRNRKIADSRDGVHEGHINFDGLSDKVLNLAQHGQVVLGLDVLRVCGV